ncbi:hypothetical protein ACFQ9X_33970 [Catenulispora yoronensis]
MPPAPTTPASSAPPAPKAVFDAFAGPGCPAPAGGGYSAHGWYVQGTQGWYSHSSGGWAGNRCDGSMQSMPMSGKAGTDAGNMGLWWFGTGAVTQGSCDIGVYVPNDGKPSDTYGTAAKYVVFNPSTYAVTTSFTVNQTANRGRWMWYPAAPPAAGSPVTKGFPVTNGSVGLHLMDQGVDYTISPLGHYGISAARLYCTSD